MDTKSNNYTMRIAGAPKVEITMTEEKARYMVDQLERAGVRMSVWTDPTSGDLEFAVPVSRVAVIHRDMEPKPLWDD